MMGKAFFGKLLNKRQDKPGPEDHADPTDGHSAVDVDVAPATEENAPAISTVGGDGQSAQLPDVSPTPVSDRLQSENSDVSAYAESREQEEVNGTPAAVSYAHKPEYDSRVYADGLDGFNHDDAGNAGDGRGYDHADGHGDVNASDDADAYGPSAHLSVSDGYHAADAYDATADDLLSGPPDGELDLGQLSDEDNPDDGPPYISLDDFVVPEDFEEDAYAEDSIADSANAPSPDWSEDDHENASAPEDASNVADPLPAKDAAGDDAAAAVREAAAAAARDAAAAVAERQNASLEHDAPPHTEMLHHTQSPEAASSPVPVGNAHVQARPDDRATPLEPGAADDAAAPPPQAGALGSQRSAEPSVPQARQSSPPTAPPPADGAAAPPPSVAHSREGESQKGRTKPARPVYDDADLRGIKDRVVIRLLDKQLVSTAHVKAALAERNKSKLKATLWRIVAHQKGVNRDAIYREAALTYAFVERKLEEKEVDLEFVRQVADVFPEKRRNRLIELRVVPIGYEFEQQTQMLRVVFLTHDPSLPAVRELMQELNLERYELQYAPEQVVKDLLAKAFPRKNEYLERMSDDPLAYDLGLSYEDEKGELIDEEALEAEINRSSLINLFEAALVESVLKGASDIHIYPNAKRQVEIHFRIDGRLVLWHLEDKVHPESLLAVIKDNTMNVDRFERDMAQDGFIQRKVDDTLIRYRVSILPIATAQQSLHAESIVIRVLDDRKVLTDLSQLGLLKGALDRFDMAIRQPHGMVILTGPTGSGKSTTLVAALHQVVDPEINVLTVEDPVEYIIPGVRQIKLNHKLDLEQALRSILRHDPDVVMVGEMRDRPTAELAIKLANTGHLTFSTLHTNDAPSAVSRLYKMGVEPFLIAYAINLVVAQRLIRALCTECKVVDRDPDPILLDRLGFSKEDLASTTLYKASGDPTCKKCKGTGYRGRRAISEALYFSRAIRHMIVEADSKIDEDALRAAAKKEGMLTLQDSAREVVKMGTTSVDEMMRVTAIEE